MPSMTKVKGGYKVFNKETGKTVFVKQKSKAEGMVKKGYKGYLKKKYKKSAKDNVDENIIKNGGSDYGGQLFKAENWLN